MSLDLVEFVMAVEEHFHVRIKDEDAGRLGTVGQLIDYLADRLQVVPLYPCRTQQAFHRVRRAFVARLDAPRGAIRPAALLEQLVPREERRVLWARLCADAGIEPPPLTPSREARAAVRRSSLVSAERTFSIGHLLLPLLHSLVIASCSYLACLIWLSHKAQVEAMEFGPGCTTVAHLVRLVAGKMPPPTNKGSPCWSREHLAAGLHLLIVSNFGIADYSEESRFMDFAC